jgi:dTDP-4-amino-4,6-dideoxygalactose transaminase
MMGEVIVPSFTFIATAHALQWQEITPVFCDIDPATHTLDPEQIERLITPRTTGIIGVHTWGRPCDIERITTIANRRELKLVFDAAHAFGCSYNGRAIGSFGDAEVFSFHATKFVNTFEGGAVLTDSDETARKVRLMKNFGFSGVDNVIYIGTNGKMNEFCAAVGLTSLVNMDQFVAANRSNYLKYRQGLSDLLGVEIAAYPESERNNYQYVVLEIDERETGISRDELVETLKAERILARRYFFPGSHAMEPYASYYPHSPLLLPNTLKLVQRVMLLPTGTAVDEGHIEVICGLIRLILREPGRVRTRLSELSSDRD